MEKYNESDEYTLYNDNCVNVLSKLTHSVDLIVTSPPYEKIRAYKGYTFDFQKVALGCIEALKPGGVIVWVVADQYVDGGQSCESMRQAIFFTEWGMKLHDLIIYAKKGQGKIAQNRYRNIWEYMFVFSKGSPKTTNIIKDHANITAGHSQRKASPGREKRGKEGEEDALDLREGNYVIPKHSARPNIWYYDIGHRKSASDQDSSVKHPAIFPIDLARDHILSWSNPGDVVLDPMAGSGTTMRAAMELGRVPVGIEISEEYCDDITRRLSQSILEIPPEEETAVESTKAVDSGRLF